MSENQKPDGGPAFPHSYAQAQGGLNGMTMRQFYAANAMQGLMSAPGNDFHMLVVKLGPAGVAKEAFAYADAMIAAEADHG